MKMSESSKSTIHAGAESAVLEPCLAADSLGGQEIEGHSSNELDAAIGIGTGLIGGIAFWILAYLLFGLVTSFA